MTDLEIGRLSRQAQCNPLKGAEGGRRVSVREGAVTMEARSEGCSVRSTRPTIAGSEDGKKEPQTKECGRPLEAEKARKTILPEKPQKECSPAHILILPSETRVRPPTYRTER